MLELLLSSFGVSPGLISMTLLWVGIFIICGVIFALIKQVETRLVLIAAGFLLCFLTKKPMEAFKAFEDSMVIAGLIKTILSVMGFAYVMKYTKCDAHLVNLMVGLLAKMRFIIIPGTVIVTAFVNISLASAAGCAAAVGAIMIPLLISLGIHPGVAAAAVMAGTYGSMLSPGLSHNAFIANMIKWDVINVIAVHYWVDIITVLIGAVGLTIVAMIRKEDKGYVPDSDHTVAKLETPKIGYAIVPIIPVLLLIISAYISGPSAPDWGKGIIAQIPWFKNLSVVAAMLIGTMLGIVATRTSPTACVKEFFNGAGNSYGSIMGIIIAAGVFVAGMKAAGLVDAGITAMKGATGVAKWAAGLGPFVLGVITGSGDAATLAFNQAVSPHAAEFGMKVENMASLATLGGALGRTMSPLAGAAIVCAGLAGVNPIEIAKRNAPAMIVAVVVAILMF